jgi:hypothetical protein
MTVLSAPVSKINQTGAESFTFACNKTRLLDKSNGISSELLPEMNRACKVGEAA